MINNIDREILDTKITVYLSNNTNKDLEKLSKEFNTTVSGVSRIAIKLLLANKDIINKFNDIDIIKREEGLL